MLFCYQLEDMLGDFPNGFLPLVVGFLEDVPEVITQLLRNGLLCFQPFSHLVLEDCDSVIHLVLNSGAVEEFGVAFSFFEQVDFGFLSPKGFLLVSSFLQPSC